MKLSILTLATSALIATTFATASHASDAETPTNSFDSSFFFTVRAATGPMLEENSFKAPTLGQSGHFEDRLLSGISGEVGYFINENFRVSAELTYGRIDHDDQVFDTGVTLELDGHTDVFQGFIKVAYEVGLEDVGFESEFASRSRVYALAGVGLTHLKNDAVLRSAPFGDGVADGSDTIVQGKIGGGFAYAITENIDFISEYNYIFGGDADVTLSAVPIGTQPVEIGANAHSFQVGLRFRF